MTENDLLSLSIDIKTCDSSCCSWRKVCDGAHMAKSLNFVLQVKVLYVRNLTQKASEDDLKETFERFGAIERVKKIKDYAFIHFSDRENAIKAMEELQVDLLPLFLFQRVQPKQICMS